MTGSPVGSDPDERLSVQDGTFKILVLAFQRVNTELYGAIFTGHAVVALSASTYAAHGTHPGHDWSYATHPVFEKMSTSLAVLFFTTAFMRRRLTLSTSYDTSWFDVSRVN